MYGRTKAEKELLYWSGEERYVRDKARKATEEMLSYYPDEPPNSARRNACMMDAYLGLCEKQIEHFQKRIASEARQIDNQECEYK